MARYVPGIFEELQPALRGIEQGLTAIFNPNKQFQEYMRAQIAQNPSILQELADAERNTPGMAQTLGLGNLTQALQATPESYKNMMGRNARTELMINQQAASDSTRKSIGARTDDELEFDKARTHTAKVQAEFARPEAQMQQELRNLQKTIYGQEIEEGAWRAGRRQSAAQIMNRYGGDNLKALQGAFNGEVDASVLYELPGFNNFASDFFQKENADRAFRWSQFVSNRDFAAAEQERNKAERARALQLTIETGAGSPDGFYELLSNPTAWNQTKIDIEEAKRNPTYMQNLLRGDPKRKPLVDAMIAFETMMPKQSEILSKHRKAALDEWQQFGSQYRATAKEVEAGTLEGDQATIALNQLASSGASVLNRAARLQGNGNIHTIVFKGPDQVEYYATDPSTGERRKLEPEQITKLLSDDSKDSGVAKGGAASLIEQGRNRVSIAEQQAAASRAAADSAAQATARAHREKTDRERTMFDSSTARSGERRVVQERIKVLQQKLDSLKQGQTATSLANERQAMVASKQGESRLSQITELRKEIDELKRKHGIND